MWIILVSRSSLINVSCSSAFIRSYVPNSRHYSDALLRYGMVLRFSTLIVILTLISVVRCLVTTFCLLIAFITVICIYCPSHLHPFAFLLYDDLCLVLASPFSIASFFIILHGLLFTSTITA